MSILYIVHMLRLACGRSVRYPRKRPGARGGAHCVPYGTPAGQTPRRVPAVSRRNVRPIASYAGNSESRTSGSTPPPSQAIASYAGNSESPQPAPLRISLGAYTGCSFSCFSVRPTSQRVTQKVSISERGMEYSTPSKPKKSGSSRHSPTPKRISRTMESPV